jgi:hypothetical protein
MLKIRVLKTKHSGTGEAEKLESEIERCDVYFPESCGRTAVSASDLENAWRILITNPLGRLIYPALTIDKPSTKKGEIEYNKRQNDLLFRYRKPLHYLERFSVEEGSLINKFHDQAELRIQTGYELMVFELMEEGAYHFYNGIIDDLVTVDKRDKHIAKNANNVEKVLVAMYPALRRKKWIYGALQVGSDHTPEQFLRVPYTIVPLDDDNDPAWILEKTIRRLVRTGATQEDVVHVIMPEVIKERDRMIAEGVYEGNRARVLEVLASNPDPMFSKANS